MHSPLALAVEWSNCTPAGNAAFAEVSKATGRELAWQSRHDDGCEGALSESWNFCDVLHVNAVGGGRWQSAQSCGTAGVAVGDPFFQRTASCFISGEGGVRAGFVASGPTNPFGTDVAWQSRHAAG